MINNIIDMPNKGLYISFISLDYWLKNQRYVPIFGLLAQILKGMKDRFLHGVRIFELFYIRRIIDE
jgi:hypothetical protein